jgi:hypothetical protein
MSARDQAFSPSADIERVRHVVTAGLWRGLAGVPIVLLVGVIAPALSLAGVSRTARYTVESIGVVAALWGHFRIRAYYRRRFGSVGPEHPRAPFPIPAFVLVCMLVLPVVAARLSPSGWPSLAFSAELGLLLLLLWWRSGFRRWHWLAWAAVCGGALFLPLQDVTRYDLSILAAGAGVVLDSFVNHFQLVRLVRPVPEEPDGQAV